MTGIVETALELHDAGICVVPARADGTKAPIDYNGSPLWTHRQRQRPDRATVEQYFADPARAGFGVVGGAVSDHLEILEVEGRFIDAYGDDVLDRAMAAAGIGELWQRVADGWTERSPSGGLHWPYRCPDGTGNVKLAKAARDADGNRETLIETRGEGGFMIMAPSNGATHPTGGSWVRVVGGPSTVATITADERAAVHAVCAQFDQSGDDGSGRLDYNTPPADGVRVRDLDPGNADSRPGLEFEAVHDCHDVLQAAGFHTPREHPDGRRGGTATSYTRPGKNAAHGSSATVYADGRCTIFSTSVDVPNEVDERRKLSPWQLHVHLNYRGDFADAAREWRRTHPRPGTPAPTATDLVGTQADPEVDTGVHLPDSFWDTTETLQLIRQTARARRAPPDLVLAGCLTRMISLIHPNVVLPAIVGSIASLNYVTGVIGQSSGGKTISNKVSGEIVDTSELGHRNNLGIGTGEGLVDAYLNADPDDQEKGIKVARDPRALFYCDEAELVTKAAERAGATLLPVLRSIISGDVVSMTLAKAGGRSRHLPAHAYRFAAILNYQPTKAESVLDDTAGGTPQRFIWAHAGDPDAPDDLPDDPRLKITAPTPVGLEQAVINRRNVYLIPVAPAVVTELQDLQLQKLRGVIRFDEDDGHEGLLRLKASVALAALHGRLEITDDDWALARMVVDTSKNIRADLKRRQRQRADEADQKRRDRHVRDTEAGEAARLDVAESKAAAQIERDIARIKTLIRDAVAPVAQRDLSQGLSASGNKTDRRDAALTEGVDRGIFHVGPDGKVGLR